MTSFTSVTTEPGPGSPNHNGYLEVTAGKKSPFDVQEDAILTFVVVNFLMIVGIIVVIAMVAAASAQKAKLTDAYNRLARRYGGHCTPGGWASRPSAHFVHAGSRVIVDIYSTGGEHATHYTQVHFRGLQPTLRCEVYPEGMWSRVGKLMGVEDVLIGSPDFDDRYIIKGGSHAALCNLLSPGVQQQIEFLRRFLANGNIYVSFDRRELLVKKLSLIRDYHTLLAFTQLAIELYDRAVLTAEKGIEFVKDVTPPEITEAVCQICGETIGSDAVFCRRCRTPHHRDCWHYYGACSTYGCQETKYLRPTSRRAERARKKMQQ